MGAIAAVEGERQSILDCTVAAVRRISAQDRKSERGRETKSPARGQKWRRGAAVAVTSLSLLSVDDLLLCCVWCCLAIINRCCCCC